MSPEAQRIAIAEAQGWKGPQHPDTQERIKTWPYSAGKSIWWLDPQGKEQMISSVPDYLSDLNAMREAEKGLTEDQAWEQVKILTDWKPAPAGFPLIGRSQAITLMRATAAQRAEAFLRAVGKWSSR